MELVDGARWGVADSGMVLMACLGHHPPACSPAGIVNHVLSEIERCLPHVEEPLQQVLEEAEAFLRVSAKWPAPTDLGLLQRSCLLPPTQSYW